MAESRPNRHGVEGAFPVMVRIVFSCAALLAAVLPALGCPPPQPGLKETVLTVHNGLRAEIGVNALTWSDQLACDALSWAHHLASLGSDRLEHASPQER